MPRYIDADALKQLSHEEWDDVLVWDESGKCTADQFCDLVDSIPTADVVEKELYDRLLKDAINISEALDKYQTADFPERNVGKWEKMWHSYFKQELPCCSVCGHFSAMRWKYCPECGSRNEVET